jgi:hypothetical protein
MKLNRRQLRRLIESTILEQAGAKPLVPKEVREELANNLRLSGLTALALDENGEEGVAVIFGDVGTQETNFEDIENAELAFKRLKRIYGDDRVVKGTVERLKGGSAAIKGFGIDSGVAERGEGAKAFVESFIKRQLNFAIPETSIVFIKAKATQA